MCRSGGRKSSLPGCVSWQPTALHLPAIELHLGLFTTLTPLRGQLHRAPIQRSLCLSLGIPCWIYLSTVTCQLSCNALSLTLLHSLWDSLDCEFILLLRLSSLVRCVFVLLPSSSSRGFNQPSSTAANYNCKERQRYSGRERKREWQRCWQFNFVSTTIEFMSCNSSAESAKSLVSKWIYDPTRTKCTARALSLG